MAVAEKSEAQALVEWTQKNPWEWVERTFGDVPLFDKQRQILDSIRDNRITHVKACHASAKTRTAAYATHWWMMAHPGEAKVLTTAPSWTQVVDNLWREIRGLHDTAKTRMGQGLGGRMLQSQWDIDPQWFAKGQSSDRGVNFQGLHSPNILIVIDEADGIPKEVWEAIDGLATSANSRILAIGNAVNPASEWKRRVDLARNRKSEKVIQIRAIDTPNVAEGRIVYPFLISPEWIDYARENYGGETANMFISKVLAEWPEESKDTLIPISWLMRARNRSVQQGVRTLGIDVARFGTDRSVRTMLAGAQLMYSKATAKEDTMKTVSRALLDIEQDAPAHVAVDITGVGGGVYDRLVEIKGATFPIVGVHNGGKSSDPERYANVAAEMWWAVRGAFERDEIGLATDDVESVDELIADLNRPTYEYVRGSLLKIDKFGLPKGSSEGSLSDEERSRRSPDRGDSYVLAYNAGMPYLKNPLGGPGQTFSYYTQQKGAVNI